MKNWSVNTNPGFKISVDVVRIPELGTFHISENASNFTLLEQDSVIGFRAKETDPLVMVYERANGAMFIKLPNGAIRTLSRIHESGAFAFDTAGVDSGVDSTDVPVDDGSIVVQDGEQSITLTKEQATQMLTLAIQTVKANPSVNQELADLVSSCCSGDSQGLPATQTPPESMSPKF